MKFFSFLLQKRIILIALITLTVIVGIVVVIFYIGRLSFDPDNVSLEIKAPEGVGAGERLEFSIIYKNKTQVLLKDARLTFHPPEHFEGGMQVKQWDIGNIPPGAEGSFNVDGRIFGPKNSVKYANARLSFWPIGFNSPFEKWTSTTFVITTLPLILDLEAPEEVTSGQQMEYSISLENTSDTTFKNLELRLAFPDDLEFITSSPPPSQKNHIWQISEFLAREKKEFRITGILSGDLDENKIVHSVLGGVWDSEFVKYLEATASTQISAFPLIISQLVNGQTYCNANWGELLRVQIRYKNTADIGAKEAIIKCELQGKSLDFSTLNVGRGFFDDKASTITWRAAANPELKILSPGEEGEVSFSVRLLESPPVAKFSDKEFRVVFRAFIDSPTVPIPPGKERIVGLDTLNIKVNSRLTLVSKGFYKEETVDIVNSGPIPPKVGEATTYTIHWYLTNLTNDVEEAVVEADVPDGVNWRGLFLPPGAFLRYNERTGKLIWDVSEIPANTGVLLPVKRVVFQLSVTPSLPQAGKEIILIESAGARAKDTFTGADLSSSAKKISTALPDDPSIGGKGGIVVKGLVHEDEP